MLYYFMLFTLCVTFLLCISVLFCFIRFIIMRRQMTLVPSCFIWTGRILGPRDQDVKHELFFMLSHWSKTWACYLVLQKFPVGSVPFDRCGGCKEFVSLLLLSKGQLLVAYSLYASWHDVYNCSRSIIVIADNRNAYRLSIYSAGQ